MIVTSYRKLDLIVAESLGCVEGNQEIDMGEMTSPDYFSYFAPKEEIESDDFDEDNWVMTHGECPNFSLNWGYCQYILAECDRTDCLVEMTRTKEAISFLIRPADASLWTSNNFKPITVGLKLPRIISLGLVLAWLNFKGYDFDFEPELSCLGCRFLDENLLCKHPDYEELVARLYPEGKMPNTSDLEPHLTVCGQECSFRIATQETIALVP